MTEYTIRGSFRARGGHQRFEKVVDAPNADVARDRVYAAFGAEHGLKRPLVDIEEVQG